MSNVFVLDTNKQPLNTVHPGRARTLLSSGKAAVFKRYPFTIILKCAVESPQVQPLRVKIDPGSKTTGMAVVNDATGDVVFAAELSHRGQAIKSALDDRRAIRRSRRQRHTRYRKPRWKNRKKNEGRLAPSLMSRVYNIETWVARLRRLCPITSISMELVRFDLQQMENPEISGIEYQQGTLVGYEVREYLLDKWNRMCAYCSKKDVPLQVEHIHPRAKGGTKRISNLTLACEPCNVAKGTQDIRVFLAHKPDVLKRILAQAKAPLKDAAAVNTTRRVLYERLQKTGLPVECGSGGRTKFNRSMRNLEKTHWLDAACVGESTPEQLHVTGVRPLLIKAMGSGHRHVCKVDGYGFPVRVDKDTRAEVQNGRLSGKERHKKLPHLMKQKVVSGKLVDRPTRRIGGDSRQTIEPREHKRVYGFQTGDMVKASIPKGRNAGTHVGRMIMQSSGTFYFGSGQERVYFSWKYCKALHRNDRYQYSLG